MFNLSPNIALDLKTIFTESLPDNWVTQLCAELNHTASTLQLTDFIPQFERHVSGNSWAVIPFKYLYTVLFDATSQVDKEGLRRLFCENISQDSQTLTVLLSKTIHGESLISYLLDFQELICKQEIEHYRNSNHLPTEYHAFLMPIIITAYEPMGAIYYIQASIKEKLVTFGYEGAQPSGYSAPILENIQQYLSKIFAGIPLDWDGIFICDSVHVTDINWSIVKSYVLMGLRLHHCLNASDKVFNGLYNHFSGQEPLGLLDLDDLQHNQFSVFIYSQLLSETDATQGYHYLSQLFSIWDEAHRPVLFLLYVLHQKHRMKPLDLDCLKQLRQDFNINLDFLTGIQNETQLAWHKVYLSILPILSPDEIKTVFETTNPSQQNYLLIIIQKFPALFSEVLAILELIPLEDQMQLLLQNDLNGEHIIFYAARSNHFHLLMYYLQSYFDNDFIGFLLLHQNSSGKNIFSAVDDSSFPILCHCISNLSSETRYMLMSQRIEQKNLLFWILRQKPHYLSELLTLLEKSEPNLFVEFIVEGEDRHHVMHQALETSLEAVVMLMSFIKIHHPKLIFEVFKHAPICSDGERIPLLSRALMLQTDSCDYLIGELNDLSVAERQYILTKNVGDYGCPLMFATIMQFKHREILLSCLSLQTSEMQTRLLKYPFVFDDPSNPNMAQMSTVYTRLYFEDLLELDDADFVTSLLADKFMFNKSQSINEQLFVMLQHGANLCSTVESSTSIVTNFNRFVNVMLAHEEFEPYFIQFSKLAKQHIRKDLYGVSIAVRFALILHSMFNICLKKNHSRIFVELAAIIQSKQPALLVNLFDNISPSDWMNAHANHHFLFFDASFDNTCFKYVLDIMARFPPSERAKLLVVENGEYSGFLSYVLERRADLIVESFSLLQDIHLSAVSTILLEGDDQNNHLIMQTVAAGPQYIQILLPYIEPDLIDQVFSKVNLHQKRLLQLAHEADNGCLEILITYLYGLGTKRLIAIIQCYSKVMQQHCLGLLDEPDEMIRDHLVRISHAQFSMFNQANDAASQLSEPKRPKYQGNSDATK